MDLNLVVLCGRVATPPEHRTLETGGTVLRVVMTVATGHPHRRVDLLPVIVFDPPDDLMGRRLVPGVRFWVSGRLQLRFSDDPATDRRRRTGLQIIADHVTVRDRLSHPHQSSSTRG